MADCDNTTAVVFAIVFGVITGLCLISSCWSVCDGAQRPGRRSHPPPKDDPRFPYFMSETTGLWLYRSVTMPPPGVEPKALVVFSHGYAEYCDRYAAAAREFAKRGVVFWAFDFEGHGRSDGER
jgi:pimeloyl-ACP methyl ester carboxylesterase